MTDDPLDRVRDTLHGGLHALRRRARVLSDFKNFIARGSALDLAVGVVIGAAFNSVVQSLVRDVLTPLVSIPGSADFGEYRACLRDASAAPGDCAVTLQYGRFVTTLISFLLTAAAVFFFVVRPLNTMREWRRAAEEDAAPATRTCPECLTEVPAAALRCRACSIALPPLEGG